MKEYVVGRKGKDGTIHLYLGTEKREYFLFAQKYRPGIKEFFKNPVLLDRAMDFSKARYNAPLEKIMEKLPPSIHYIEKEYDVAVFNQTKRAGR